MSVIVRPYRPGEEEYIAQAHRKVYLEEYRWGPSFSDYAMKIPRDFAAQTHTDSEGMWVAEADGKPVGSIMLCRTDDDEVGQLRLFLVDKEYRSMGAGSMLLSTLFDRARSGGFKRLVLYTASPLSVAISKYKRLGFVETERVLNTDWNLDGESLYEIRMEAEL